ncbi:hypothetical protein [Variovorax sp. GT1P44]|uniref:hypothetical protein n=1 Tax=Variovorax sp. GT1P44 TaxID=3443742 RepID=UPI003F449374
MNLIGELDAATSGVEVFRKLGEYMAAPEEKGIDKAPRRWVTVRGKVRAATMPS